MFRLHTAPQPTMLRLLQRMLADQNIVTEVRREQVGVTAGMIPYTETWAELWFVDGDEDKARRLVEEFVTSDASRPEAPPWRCGHCGESVEDSFDICWNCGTARGSSA